MVSSPIKNALRFSMGALHHILPASLATTLKEFGELRYWKRRKASEGDLSNKHYAFFYTEHFGISGDHYAGKKIIDIGCGPRGSLEWADMAAERIGLDPLAEEYLGLGASKHHMKYVVGTAEEIPFPDRYFDSAFSFNSLDHVGDLSRAIESIGRVLLPGGDFLLLTDVNHAATVNEPQEFGWDIVEQFLPLFEVVRQNRFEKRSGGLYESLQSPTRWDPSNHQKRYGILSAHFVRRQK